jgi:hypothetical protein
MASTIGPIDSGSWEPWRINSKDTGIRVRHVGAGTGAAQNRRETSISSWPRQVAGGEILAGATEPNGSPDVQRLCHPGPRGRPRRDRG